MYCDCGKAEASGVWYDLTGQTNQLQVHPKCRKPHRLYFERFTAMRAPRDANALIHLFSRRDGVSEITFACNNGSKKMVEVLGTQPDAVLKMWELLDDAMDHIMEPDGDREMTIAWKSRARTLATCISLCMPTHYPDADAVAVEAKLRYESGDEEGNVTRESPGLADDLYVPPQPQIGAPTGNRIPDKAVDFARATVKAGEMSAADIADMYRMTEAEVNAQLGLETTQA